PPARRRSRACGRTRRGSCPRASRRGGGRASPLRLPRGPAPAGSGGCRAPRYHRPVAARFLLHPWDPDTLLTITEQDDVGDEQLELGFEVDEDAWQPLSPADAPPRTVHFVDGARRHDA